jgi:glycosyltransferase 2 family protein
MDALVPVVPETNRLVARVAVGLVVAVFAYAGLLAWADAGVLWSSAHQVPHDALAVALLLSCANYAARWWRWSGYLRALSIPATRRDDLLIFLSGFAMTITPGKLGELIKPLLLRRTMAVPLARSTPIVIAERVTDLVALVLLVGIGALPRAPLGGAILLAGALALSLLSTQAWVVRVIPGRLREKARPALEALRELLTPRRFASSLALALFAWSMQALALLVIARPFAQLGLLDTLLAYGAPLLAGALAMLPGGLGLTEASMVGVLRELSAVSAGEASAITLLCRLVTLWFAVALGFLALALRARPQRVERWGVTLLLIVPCAWWLIPLVRVYALLPLARDQLIFQYTAWAIDHGQRLYRDIHDVNGPLITGLHWLAQAFGGAEDAVLRGQDLALQSVLFAGLGALLPELVGELPRWSERVRWAAITLAGLLASYLRDDFWNTLQRESSCFALVLGSCMLQVIALRPHYRRAGLWLLAAGFVGGIAWLGKPSFVLFAPFQVFALLLGTRWTRALALSLGFALGAGSMFAVASSYGDMRIWLRLMSHDVPRAYRFLPALGFGELWQRSLGAPLLLAFALVLVGSYLLYTRRIAARALPLVLLALPAFGNVIAQGKGFLYHYEPVHVATHLAALLAVLASWHTAQRVIAALLFTIWTTNAVATSSAQEAVVMLDPTHPWRQHLRLRLREFSTPDFRLEDDRDVAEYLLDTTAEDERVQIFGMDPAILFRARRLSATPYIYGWDVALQTAFDSAHRVGASEPQLHALRAIASERCADFTRRLESQPPSRFAISDVGVFLQPSPRVALDTHCPRAFEFIRTHYRLDRHIGVYTLYTPMNEQAAR